MLWIQPHFGLLAVSLYLNINLRFLLHQDTYHGVCTHLQLHDWYRWSHYLGLRYRHFFMSSMSAITYVMINVWYLMIEFSGCFPTLQPFFLRRWSLVRWVELARWASCWMNHHHLIHVKYFFTIDAPFSCDIRGWVPTLVLTLDFILNADHRFN